MRSLFSAALALTPLLGACGGRAGELGDVSPANAEAAGLTDAELEALFRARSDSATARFSLADVEFVTGMIGHHAQALEIAALVPTRAQAPALHILAARVMSGQQDEIGLMRRWLAERGQPVPTVPVESGGHLHLPGMLTPEQIHELEEARSADFDRLFLRYMIQHHQGAVAMVHDLFASDGAAQEESVFRIASDVQVDQITEIARMEQMLATLSAPTPG